MALRKRSRRVWIAVVVLGLAVATLAIVPRLDVVQRIREDGAIRFTDYATLYYPQELPRVEGIATAGDGALILKMAPSPTSLWRVDPPEGDPYTVQDDHPRLQLVKGIHRYRLRAVEGAGEEPAPFTFGVTVSFAPPVSEAASPDVADAPAVVVTTASVPVGRFQRLPLRKLTYQIDDFASDEVAAARATLREIGVSADDPSWVRMEKISAFLLHQLDEHRGTPTETARFLTPLQQYQRALAGDLELWCGNFAAIYGFFATVAGIPTRIMTIKRSLDGVVLSAHSFAESYIRERHQWAYSDLTFHTAYLQNAKGDFLNAVQVVRMFEAGTDAGLVPAMVREGTISRTRDRDEERYIRMHLDPTATIIFHWPYADRNRLASRLHRYFWQPELAYTANGTTHPNGIRMSAWLMGGLGMAGMLFGVGTIVRWLRRTRASRTLRPVGEHV